MSTMSTLHVSKFGQDSAAPVLVLLHGWGSSSKIWQTCVAKLSQQLQIYCIDLPGHGKSHAIEWDESIDQALELLADVLPAQCVLVGWSLGGLLAQWFINRYPARVQGLMLIASTPKFVASQDWPHAMPASTFKKFVKQYEVSPSVTIKQFNALQTLHGNSSKQIMHDLQQAETAAYDQSPENIRWGLTWLQELDLREINLPEHLPIYLLQGENDQVSSMRVAEDTAAIWKSLRLCKIPNAGHLPFISHQDQFIELVQSLLEEANLNHA